MRLLVLQPYLPDYRVPLFDEISRLCELTGDQLRVVHGDPAADQRLRGDSATAAWAIRRTRHEVRTPLGGAYWRRVRKLAALADVTVTELDAGNLDAWYLGLSGSPLVLWGHGRAYVNEPSRLSESLQIRLARLADEVMTYSAGGRQALLDDGLTPSKVTAVGNATDTTSLRRLYLNSGDAVVSEFLATHRLEGRRLATLVGGLDASKRLDFVVEAVQAASALDPNFTLVVGGRGADEAFIKSSESDHLRYIGAVDRPTFALLAHVAQSMWMPGRVGLVAVDAQALGLPVITTEFPFHAPEVEFLERGSELIVAPNDPKEFAVRAFRLARDRLHCR